MITRLFLALALLGPGPSFAEAELTLPNAPLNQIVDRSGWLDAERTQRLESILQGYRQNHGVDVLVVVWDHEIPAEVSLHDLAKKVGEEWTRSEFWAVILTEPDPVGRPEVHYGGATAESIEPRSLDTIVSEVVTRGLKDWSDERRIEAIALGLSREFVYLAQRREQELAVIREKSAHLMAERSEAHRFSMLAVVLQVLGGIVLVGGIGAGWIFLRQRRPFEFPETRWRRRLGGEWSGGSTIMVKASSTSANS